MSKRKLVTCPLQQIITSTHDAELTLKVSIQLLDNLKKIVCCETFATDHHTNNFATVQHSDKLTTNQPNHYFSLGSAFLAHLSLRLKVSYCDRSSSGVRRPASVVRLQFALNKISSETTVWILSKFFLKHPGTDVYKSCSNHDHRI
jgi:hypothetical protein